MYIKYIALIFAALLVATEANSFAFKSSPAVWPRVEQSNARYPTLSANINQYVDNTVRMLVPFIRENGLDPMRLPEVSAGFQVRPVLVTYSARVTMHDGRMTGLVNIGRSGNQMIYYSGRTLRVRVQLEFRDLEFNYRYLVRVMNIGPNGGIVGSLSDFVVAVELMLDFNRDEIHLQHFALAHVGSLRVRLTGNILYDWLATPVVNIFLRIFNDTIIRAVENNIRNAARGAINGINADLREIIRNLESYN